MKQNVPELCKYVRKNNLQLNALKNIISNLELTLHSTNNNKS